MLGTEQIVACERVLVESSPFFSKMCCALLLSLLPRIGHWPLRCKATASTQALEHCRRSLHMRKTAALIQGYSYLLPLSSESQVPSY